MHEQPRHPASWWAQFPEQSERFDTAFLTEGLGDLITVRIPAPLLRREAELALEIMVRHLNKPASEELAHRARDGADRLATTVGRLQERSGDALALPEAHALVHLLSGRFGEAAAAAESFTATHGILRVFVGALRIASFDNDLAVKMLAAGQEPAAALRSGMILGKYSWWPSWLLKIVGERAMAGILDDATVAAMDTCAYAELSPAQARIARRLLSGEETLIDASATRLEGLGETDAAEKLRRGDLTTVALAARLILA
ncbi:hypothetical protein [Actinoplanes palleronii]|uniref:Uncharacterized protein n=1 Tax=Actinoplanes palleronii TaxID=113570 RepID=A0ABQ4BP70_9ACTN|nr:hypothetical protein [Actinoplanes palleronii]GIE72466.1 hypothetical protein Apa02nite_085740 [Actinoplanes palleronii]